MFLLAWQFLVNVMLLLLVWRQRVRLDALERSAGDAQLATTQDLDGILHRLARLDDLRKPEGDVLEFVKARDAIGRKCACGQPLVFEESIASGKCGTCRWDAIVASGKDGPDAA